MSVVFFAGMNGRPIGGSLFNHVPFFSGEVSLARGGAGGKKKRVRSYTESTERGTQRAQRKECDSQKEN
jgi:hypothetical protein